MNKQEFLDKLRLALNGRVSAEVVTDTLSYYEDYINAEVRMGKTMDEVMSVLGDPRLIARTIIATSSMEERESAEKNKENKEQERHERHLGKNIQLPGGLVLAIILILLFVVIAFVFRILIGFAPFLMLAGVVVLLWNVFKDLKR